MERDFDRMRTYTCDRCGKEIHIDAGGISDVYNTYVNDLHRELCKACYKKHQTLLSKQKKEIDKWMDNETGR